MFYAPAVFETLAQRTSRDGLRATCQHLQERDLGFAGRARVALPLVHYDLCLLSDEQECRSGKASYLKACEAYAPCHGRTQFDDEYLDPIVAFRTGLVSGATISVLLRRSAQHTMEP